MKKIILAATTAAMLFVGAAASAQPYGGAYGDRDRDGVPNYADRHPNHDRYDDRRHDRHDDRRAYRHYARGERFDHYRSHTYIVNDYRSHGWRAPPRGYAYYRTDGGDIVLAALATGVIASVIANSR